MAVRYFYFFMKPNGEKGASKEFKKKSDAIKDGKEKLKEGKIVRAELMKRTYR